MRRSTVVVCVVCGKTRFANYFKNSKRSWRAERTKTEILRSPNTSCQKAMQSMERSESWVETALITWPEVELAPPAQPRYYSSFFGAAMKKSYRKCKLEFDSRLTVAVECLPIYASILKTFRSATFKPKFLITHVRDHFAVFLALTSRFQVTRRAIKGNAKFCCGSTKQVHDVFARTMWDYYDARGSH